MQAAGRGVQREVKVLADGANALQGATEKSGQIRTQARLIQTRALERCIVIAGQYPGFIGNTRCVRAQRQIIATGFDHSQGLALLLLDDVAKNTALLADKIFASCAQFVKDAARHEHGGCDLRSGMVEFLARVLAVVLEEADVLDARIALEVEDAFSGEAQEVRDLFVAGIPQVAIVTPILDENLV